VRFLLDQNVSPVLVGLLAEAGHSAEHLRDLGLSRAPDHEVLATATTTGAVLVSSDTDFGELLARSNAAGPSVILLRRQEDRRADDIAALIIANLDAVADDLSAGALVVLDNERIRIRSLPFRPEN
jgi:predicted nuclease of predicted toxin-antitoxin system